MDSPQTQTELDWAPPEPSEGNVSSRPSEGLSETGNEIGNEMKLETETGNFHLLRLVRPQGNQMWQLKKTHSRLFWGGSRWT